MTQDQSANQASQEQNRSASRTQSKVAIIGLVGAVGAAVVAGASGVVSALIAKTSTPEPQATATVSTSEPAAHCKQFDEQPLTDKFSGSDYPGVKLKWVHYSLTYGRDGTSPFAYLEVAGQLSGRLPPGHRLYRFGWSDPSTTDSTPKHNSGNGRYAWDVDNPIYPDENGCWDLRRRKLGYAGAQGITFKHYYGLVSDATRPCLDRLLAADKRRDGFDENALSRCSIPFLGHINIPTKPLP